MDYIRDRKSYIPFSLHDSRIVQIEINETTLILKLDRIFQYTGDEEKWYQGIIEFTGKDKWNKHSLEVMLSNEKYKGAVRLFDDKKSEVQYLASANHPAIIAEEILRLSRKRKQTEVML